MWPVEIDRKEEDRTHSILLTIGLALNKHHLLCQPIRRVCFLWVAVPQVDLFERDGSEFWICAYRAKDNCLFHVETACSFNKLNSHNGVVVKKPTGILAICADAAYNRSHVNQNVRSFFRKEAID